MTWINQHRQFIHVGLRTCLLRDCMMINLQTQMHAWNTAINLVINFSLFKKHPVLSYHCSLVTRGARCAIHAPKWTSTAWLMQPHTHTHTHIPTIKLCILCVIFCQHRIRLAMLGFEIDTRIWLNDLKIRGKPSQSHTQCHTINFSTINKSTSNLKGK